MSTASITRILLQHFISTQNELGVIPTAADLAQIISLVAARNVCRSAALAHVLTVTGDSAEPRSRANRQGLRPRCDQRDLQREAIARGYCCHNAIHGIFRNNRFGV